MSAAKKQQAISRGRRLANIADLDAGAFIAGHIDIAGPGKSKSVG
jgi:hypothetical protein